MIVITITNNNKLNIVKFNSDYSAENFKSFRLSVAVAESKVSKLTFISSILNMVAFSLDFRPYTSNLHILLNRTLTDQHYKSKDQSLFSINSQH